MVISCVQMFIYLNPMISWREMATFPDPATISLIIICLSICHSRVDEIGVKLLVSRRWKGLKSIWKGKNSFQMNQSMNTRNVMDRFQLVYIIRIWSWQNAIRWFRWNDQYFYFVPDLWISYFFLTKNVQWNSWSQVKHCLNTVIQNMFQ